MSPKPFHTLSCEAGEFPKYNAQWCNLNTGAAENCSVGSERLRKREREGECWPGTVLRFCLNLTLKTSSNRLSLFCCGFMSCSSGLYVCLFYSWTADVPWAAQVSLFSVASLKYSVVQLICPRRGLHLLLISLEKTNFSPRTIRNKSL